MSRASRRRLLRQIRDRGLQVAAVGLCIGWVWGSFAVADLVLELIGPHYRIVSAENSR